MTLTSDGPLPIAPWVQAAVEDDERVSWASLHWSGELNGNPLGDAGATAFGLPASEHYTEVDAFVTLVDADLDLYEVDRSASADTLAWASLHEAYTVTDLWCVPSHFDSGDL